MDAQIILIDPIQKLELHVPLQALNTFQPKPSPRLRFEPFDGIIGIGRRQEFWAGPKKRGVGLKFIFRHLCRLAISHAPIHPLNRPQPPAVIFKRR